ncbi:MAG TPA: hypothetical protein DEQ61_08420 [Streptomyces sp.]|nr:hypothetical protein [Streptomyces sp.]
MLNVHFRYDDSLDVARPVAVKERRGDITFELCRGLFLPEGVAALNSAVGQILAGGQWFQLWKGEVVSMASPELREYRSARIHRGPLVEQEAGPRHR